MCWGGGWLAVNLITFCSILHTIIAVNDPDSDKLPPLSGTWQLWTVCVVIVCVRMCHLLVLPFVSWCNRNTYIHIKVAVQIYHCFVLHVFNSVIISLKYKFICKLCISYSDYN